MHPLTKTLLAIVLTASAILFVGWRDATDLLQHPLTITQPTDVEIRSGEPLNALLRRLYEQKILVPERTIFYLRIYARMTGKALQIKAGEYALTPGMDGLDLLDLLMSGKVKLRELQIIEGWTFKQAMAAVNASPDLTHTLKNLSNEQIMSYLGKSDVSPEGRFFPDTYRFSKDTTDVAFLKRAYDKMQATLDQEWRSRDDGLPYKTSDEALIMASIVEKETGSNGERARVAGVFVRRLKLGMKLQTDPTVIYGMGDLYSGNIRRKDLQTDTPYNSYTRYGLPPSPICLPSKAAIHAALHPDQSKALYFVAKQDGTHQFSDTLAQHNRAVRQFQIKKPR